MMNKAMTIQILTYAIPIIVVLYIVTVVMKRVGLMKSGSDIREDKKIEKAAKEIVTSALFNPTYHQGKYYQVLPNSLLEKHARSIREAVTSWSGTDEPLIYSTFRQLPNKVNVSQLSEKYYLLFKEDMKANLVNDLNNEELAIVHEIINSLPNQ